MRVLVCGGRNLDDWRGVSKSLAEMHPTVIIQGGAPGADALARKWAECNNVPVVTYSPNWKLGKKAGPLRNQFMLEDSRPDWVVAFPGGRGTEDMFSRALAASRAVPGGLQVKFVQLQANAVSGSPTPKGETE